METKEEQTVQKEESGQGHCHTAPVKESRTAESEKTVTSGCCCDGK